LLHRFPQSNAKKLDRENARFYQEYLIRFRICERSRIAEQHRSRPDFRLTCHCVGVTSLAKLHVGTPGPSGVQAREAPVTMRIAEIRTYPLAMPIAPGEHKTAWGEYTSIGIVLVAIRTTDGLTGYGEALSRKNPRSSALLIDELYAPLLLGQDPLLIEKHWQTMARQMSGRYGGVAMEAIAALDIALWDIMGRAFGQPVHRLLGGMGRETVECYGSSISWQAPDTAKRQIEQCRVQGLRMIKLKLGAPVSEAIAWARQVRDWVGPDMALCADANWAYDVADAARVAAALHDLDFVWLEEPLIPEDVAGYARLAAKTPLRLAAGESEHVGVVARDLIASGAIGVFQPDCARSAGITETRRMVNVAQAYGVAYAPHVGGGGAVSAAANLHLAAAMPNFLTYECMIFPSALRTDLSVEPVADAASLVDGRIRVPDSPGLGLEIDFDTVGRLAAKA
jgi:galactonate dehydratase